MLTAAHASTASAQLPELPGFRDRFRAPEDRPPLPGFQQPEPQPLPEVPAPALPPGERLAPGLAFVLRDVRVEGNTVLPPADLEKVIGPYIGKKVTAEDLLALRDAVTRLYVDKGYINSGAVIPDQTIAGGVLTLKIVEGSLGQINVSGLDYLRPSYVEDRVSLPADRPLNLDDLRERIETLLADPAIARIDARLEPGAHPGEADLDLNVVERDLFFTQSRIANDRSPTVGGTAGEQTAIFRSVFGYGDPFGASFTRTQGLWEVSAAYSVPLLPNDLRAYTSFQYSNAKIVEHPFNELDISGYTTSIEGGLRLPLLRSIIQEAAVQLGLQRIWTQTYLFNHPFSFVQGVDNGETNITAIRFEQDGQLRGADYALAARSLMTFGIDALGATQNKEGPDGQFFAWLGQAQAALRLDDRGQQLVWRGDLQVASDPLLPIEQIALGGLNTIRGYREDLIVRDNGWDVSLEWRVPVVRVPLPWVTSSPDEGYLQLCPFFDAGGGWNTDRRTPDPTVVYGTGAGLRWSPIEQFSAAFYYGYALKNVQKPPNPDLQDDGIYFDVRLGWSL